MANEKRLIDANTLDTRERGNNSQRTMWHTIKRLIDNAPTVDAVEVVRCCVCQEHDHDGAVGYCNQWKKWTRMSDFCSRGERREGE